MESVQGSNSLETGVKHLHCAVCDTVIGTSLIPMTEETFGLELENETRIVKGIDGPVTTEEFIAHYANMGMDVAVRDKNGEVPEFIGTGCIATYEGVEFEIAVRGDLNGDGEITAKDSIKLKRFISFALDPSEAEFAAADIKEDDELSAKDSMLMKKLLSQ